MSESVRYNTAPAQADVWLANQITKAGAPSTITIAIQAPREISRGLIDEAVRSIGRRHPVLQSRIVFDDDGLWMSASGRAPWVRDGLDGLDAATSDSDPNREQPWSVWVASCRTNDATQLVFRFDHAYLDGESVGRIVQEFVAYCNSKADRTAGRVSSDYRVYADRMNALVAAPPDRSEKYWSALDLDEVWTAPPDSVRRMVPARRAELTCDATRRIEARASGAHLTIFAVLLAATARVVQRRVHEDAVFSIPVSQRSDAAFQDVVGQCTDLCPVVVRQSQASFDEYARSLYFEFLEAFSHMLPMAAIRRLVMPDRRVRLDAITVTLVDDIARDAAWTVSSLDDDQADRPLAIVFRRGPAGLSVVVRSELELFGEDSFAEEIANELRRL